MWRYWAYNWAEIEVGLQLDNRWGVRPQAYAVLPPPFATELAAEIAQGNMITCKEDLRPACASCWQERLYTFRARTMEPEWLAECAKLSGRTVQEERKHKLLVRHQEQMRAFEEDQAKRAAEAKRDLESKYVAARKASNKRQARRWLKRERDRMKAEDLPSLRAEEAERAFVAEELAKKKEAQKQKRAAQQWPPAAAAAERARVQQAVRDSRKRKAEGRTDEEHAEARTAKSALEAKRRKARRTEAELEERADLEHYGCDAEDRAEAAEELREANEDTRRSRRERRRGATAEQEQAKTAASHLDLAALLKAPR